MLAASGQLTEVFLGGDQQAAFAVQVAQRCQLQAATTGDDQIVAADGQVAGGDGVKYSAGGQGTAVQRLHLLLLILQHKPGGTRSGDFARSFGKGSFGVERRLPGTSAVLTQHLRAEVIGGHQQLAVTQGQAFNAATGWRYCVAAVI